MINLKEITVIDVLTERCFDLTPASRSIWSQTSPRRPYDLVSRWRARKFTM
jgi:hypothetical protein